MNSRECTKQPISPSPLIEGTIPSTKSMTDRFFIVVDPHDHVLSETEWSEVIGDNMLYMGKLRPSKSPYKISELKIFHSPLSEEAICIMKKSGLMSNKDML